MSFALLASWRYAQFSSAILVHRTFVRFTVLLKEKLHLALKRKRHIIDRMEETVFTKIIKGEIPCHKVYEDELTLAFMDIHPFAPGHVLVISKKQIDKLWDLPDEDYQAVQSTVKKVCKRIEDILEPVRIGIKVIGTDVPHAHVHVFPFSNIAEYNVVPGMEQEPDHEALADMAERLKF